MDPIEYKGFFPGYSFLFIDEELGHFGVVRAGPNVMHEMISIVPAFAVVGSIYAGVAVPVHIFRIIGVHECMLRPVAKHHYQAAQ